MIYTSLTKIRNVNIKHYKILIIKYNRLPVSVGQSLYLKVIEPRKRKEEKN